MSLPVTTPGQPSHRAMEQAAEWYALLCSDEVTERIRSDWHAWLDQDPENRLAWRYVESVSNQFGPIKTTADPRHVAEGLWQANNRVIQRRRVLAGIAALAGVGVLGWGTWRHTPVPAITQAWRADYHTATGESRELVLPDGSRLWLNTDTALNQLYDGQARRLQLVRGEILIDTASDPSRPFEVDTPQGQLRALGTRFAVRLNGEQTLLAVYEGAVRARTRQGAQTTLQAGQEVQFDTVALGEFKRADATRVAWSQGMLVAQDIPLHEVVRELRRYRNGHLGLAPEVAQLRVFGNFPLTNTDDTLAMLEAALPVHIRQTLPWWVSIEPANDK